MYATDPSPIAMLPARSRAPPTTDRDALDEGDATDAARRATNPPARRAARERCMVTVRGREWKGGWNDGMNPNHACE